MPRILFGRCCADSRVGLLQHALGFLPSQACNHTSGCQTPSRLRRPAVRLSGSRHSTQCERWGRTGAPGHRPARADPPRRRAAATVTGTARHGAQPRAAPASGEQQPRDTPSGFCWRPPWPPVSLPLSLQILLRCNPLCSSASAVSRVSKSDVLPHREKVLPEILRFRPLVAAMRWECGRHDGVAPHPGAGEGHTESGTGTSGAHFTFGETAWMPARPALTAGLDRSPPENTGQSRESSVARSASRARHCWWCCCSCGGHCRSRQRFYERNGCAK